MTKTNEAISNACELGMEINPQVLAIARLVKIKAADLAEYLTPSPEAGLYRAEVVSHLEIARTKEALKKKE